MLLVNFPFGWQNLMFVPKNSPVANTNFPTWKKMFAFPAKAYRRRKKYKTQIWVNFGGLINNKAREIEESFLNSLIVLL